MSNRQDASAPSSGSFTVAKGGAAGYNARGAHEGVQTRCASLFESAPDGGDRGRELRASRRVPHGDGSVLLRLRCATLHRQRDELRVPPPQLPPLLRPLPRLRAADPRCDADARAEGDALRPSAHPRPPARDERPRGVRRPHGNILDGRLDDLPVRALDAAPARPEDLLGHDRDDGSLRRRLHDRPRLLRGLRRLPHPAPARPLPPRAPRHAAGRALAFAARPHAPRLRHHLRPPAPPHRAQRGRLAVRDPGRDRTADRLRARDGGLPGVAVDLPLPLLPRDGVRRRDLVRHDDRPEHPRRERGRGGRPPRRPFGDRPGGRPRRDRAPRRPGERDDHRPAGEEADRGGVQPLRGPDAHPPGAGGGDPDGGGYSSRSRSSSATSAATPPSRRGWSPTASWRCSTATSP